MQDPKLLIATHLLSALMGQSVSRDLVDRVDDIDHSLEVAAELIRRRQDQGSPISDLGLRPPLSTKIREEVVERDPAPLRHQLEQRRREHADPAPPPRPGRRPTLH